LDMNQDNLRDLSNFRNRGYDYRTRTYTEMKHQATPYKAAYFGSLLVDHAPHETPTVLRSSHTNQTTTQPPNYSRDQSLAIYESASGQGLNLLLTLEILQEQWGITNVTLYGNDYLPESVHVARTILQQEQENSTRTVDPQLQSDHEPWYQIGALCQGDSTNLSHVPSNSMDIAYTGFIDPLVDPLQLWGPHVSMAQVEGAMRQLCTSLDDLHQDLLQQMQQQQQDWFASWVSELLRIVKPGHSIIVEDVGWPACWEDHVDGDNWGGVLPSWWSDAKTWETYGWTHLIEPESVAIEEQAWYPDRYNVRLQKQDPNDTTPANIRAQHQKVANQRAHDLYEAIDLEMFYETGDPKEGSVDAAGEQHVE